MDNNTDTNASAANPSGPASLLGGIILLVVVMLAIVGFAAYFAFVEGPKYRERVVTEMVEKYDGLKIETSETRMKHPGEWTIDGEKRTCLIANESLMCEIGQ